jgi:hypothetical protein
MVRPVDRRCNSEASLPRCASPPDSVVAGAGRPRRPAPCHQDDVRTLGGVSLGDRVRYAAARPSHDRALASQQKIHDRHL